MIRRFPFFQQLDAMDCGPTCLRMIAAHYGKHYTLQFLREQSFIDRDGVSLLGMSRAAEYLGFETLAAQVPLQATAEHSTALSDLPLPCIVHWEDNHFVVVYRVTEDTVYIADPAMGRRQLTHSEFENAWKGDNLLGIVLLLSPTPAFYEQAGEDEVTAKGFRYLLHFIRPYKRLLLQLALGLLAMGILDVIFPFLTQAIVDVGIDQGDLDFVEIMLWAMVALFLGEVAITILQGWILLHVGTRVNVNLVSQFLTKIMRLPIGFFDQKTTGDLLQRIYDQRRIEQFLTTSSLNALFSVFTIFVLTIVLIAYSYTIAGVFVFSAVLYFAWIWYHLKKRALVDQQRFRDMSENQNVLIELIQGMPEIKLQQSQQKRRWQWLVVQSKLFKTNTRFLVLTQYQDVGTKVVSQLKDIIIIFLSAKAVINGELSLGMMLAIQYIVGQMNVPLQQLAGILRTGQDARLSLERLGELHDFKDEENLSLDTVDEIPQEGDIELKKVSFSYNELVGYALKDISLTIPRGKVTAIVGASGSGKTTLVKLLLGFYEPQQGDIMLNNLPLSGFQKSTWRQQCGAVLQDGFIFSDSIARNIAESDEYIDKDRLIRAAKMANLGSFIQRLPQRLNTKIGPQGNGISQGQKQRILIARAIYKDPAFLFFDEATNALDAENEKFIVEQLNQFYAGRTVIVVAHRLSTVRDADNIIVLEQGQLVEQGTHEALITQQGRYYQLVSNQLELGK